MDLCLLTWIILLSSLQDCNCFRLLPVLSRNVFHLRSLPEWVHRKNENVEIFNLGADAVPSLFNSEASIESESFSMLQHTLRDLSVNHKFCLDYLGDFCVQCGANAPIDIDKPLGNFLSGDNVIALFTALYSLDPIEANLEYDGPNIYNLAHELEVSPYDIIDICRVENFNLPFGKETTLHNSITEAIREKIISRKSVNDHQTRSN